MQQWHEWWTLLTRPDREEPTAVRTNLLNADFGGPYQSGCLSLLRDGSMFAMRSNLPGDPCNRITGGNANEFLWLADDLYAAVGCFPRMLRGDRSLRWKIDWFKELRLIVLLPTHIFATFMRAVDTGTGGVVDNENFRTMCGIPEHMRDRMTIFVEPELVGDDWIVFLDPKITGEYPFRAVGDRVEVDVFECGVRVEY